jgi:hypothetical protein
MKFEIDIIRKSLHFKALCLNKPNQINHAST